MLPINVEAIRLLLHLLAASIWVGGQLVLGGLIPALKPAGPEHIRAVARRFQLLAWPSFAVLLITGVWNLLAVDPANQSSAWMMTLMVKLGLVAVSGSAAAIHVLVFGPAVRRATSPESRKRAAAASGVCEMLSVLCALGAMLLGVLLAN